MTNHILALDIAGNPFDWIAPQDAVLYYAAGKVAWELGDKEVVFRGGFSIAGGAIDDQRETYNCDCWK